MDVAPFHTRRGRIKTLPSNCLREKQCFELLHLAVTLKTLECAGRTSLSSNGKFCIC